MLSAKRDSLKVVVPTVMPKMSAECQIRQVKDSITMANGGGIGLLHASVKFKVQEKGSLCFKFSHWLLIGS